MYLLRHSPQLILTCILISLSTAFAQNTNPTIIIEQVVSTTPGDALDTSVRIQSNGSEYIVGRAPEHDLPFPLDDVGALHLFPASLGAPILTLTGTTQNERLGYSLCEFPSLTPGQAAPGVVTSAFGVQEVRICPAVSPNGFNCGFVIQKPTEAKNFGITLASTVSAGKRLLAVGATGGFTATWMPVNPYVYIYDISNPGNIQLLNRIEGQFATEFGAELHFIGDFNSNGSHELAIGIPAGGPNLIGQVIILDNLDQSYGNVRVSAGGVCSCQSGCNGAPPALVPAILGDEGFSGFGSSISSNPMHRDLIVGAPLDNEVPGSGQLRADQGTVHVFSYLSGSSAFTGALQPVIVIGDSATGSHLGTAVLGVEGSDPNTTAPTGNSIAAVVAGAPSGIYGAAKTYKYYENYPMPGAPGYSMLSYISSNGVANIPVGKSLSYFGDIDQDGTLEFSVNASGLSNPMTSLVNLIEWSPVHWSLNPGNTISTIASACTLGGNSPGAPATLAINTAQINGPIPTARIKGDITTDVGAQVFVVFGTLHASGIPFGPCSFKLNTDIVYGTQTPIHLDANAEAVVNLLPVSLPAGLNLLELGLVALIVNNSGSLKLTETQLVKVGL